MAHLNRALPEQDPWLARVARQHRANFDLWHIEDEARTPGASDADLADVNAASTPPTSCATILPRILTARSSNGSRPVNFPIRDAPLNSESPGLIIDRLSILALKIYHTREEAHRRLRSARPCRA